MAPDNEDGECKNDFVKVMDGDCVSRLGESKFCGTSNPPVFMSTTNRLCVKFYSDSSQNDQGFSATYNAIDAPSQPPGKYIKHQLYYLLTDWLAYLIGRIQSPRPDVMPDRREGITTRAAGFGFARIDTQAS